MAIPSVTLNSSHKMPVIALGSAGQNLPADVLSRIFLDAIEAGYRHFDTASLYGSEEGIGLAVAEALKLGLVSSRDELFITSKLWVTDAHPDLVLPALKNSLSSKLGLDYLDLYLIHWPIRLKQGDKKVPVDKKDILPFFDMKGTWEAMEECKRLGLVNSIGVSNCTCKKLSQLMEYATIPPAVNQVEMHVAWNQKKLLDFCNEIGVHITAWSPLAANGANWGSIAVMQSAVLKDIASVKGKTVAQVALRWLYQQGVSIAVKTYNKGRMMENLGIFDWELSKEDTEKIQTIPQFRGYQGDMFVSENGPYKTIEELWDGEI
ncbi:methylecgonone reductase-like isoform X1 [Asparagus officinalis]|uniref:methylecgonone reductase-like isoform X1 n=1 Tax=Asparagus officinalis TaxID=4686 RepID=UPI00098E1213|nr:methylecgonone reductase-like isoform X1 [Asparagus officinalis]